MNIHLIRHGQSFWQTDQSLDKDSELTTLGVKQSYYLNRYIRSMMDKNYESSIVYASPLKRSIQTVQGLEKDYTLDSRIKEASFHVASALPEFSDPQLYERELSKDRLYATFKKNLKKTLEKIIFETKHKNVYLYTHGGVIKTILRIIHDNDCVCYTINNCSVTTISWHRSRWHMARLNDISFLPEKYIT